MTQNQPAVPTSRRKPTDTRDAHGRAAKSVAALRKNRPRDAVDWIFDIGIVFKGLDGIVELVGAAILLVVTPQDIASFVLSLTNNELVLDPHGPVANTLNSMTAKLGQEAVWFAALYLLVHGIVKVVLVAALLLGRYWAYPWMIATLLAFIVYQVVELFIHPTMGLGALTLFDAVMVWLTWIEYKRHKRPAVPSDSAVTAA